MKGNYTEEEIREISKWVIRMVKFWGVSALGYVAIFYQSTLAMWILASLVVLKFLTMEEKDTSND
jgi:hypothetical protein